MARPVLPPHLITADGKKLCSVCHHPFDPRMQGLGAAFRKHVEEVHRSTQKDEDGKLTAPGVVKKAK